MTLARDGVRLRATGEQARVGGEGGPVVPVYTTKLGPDYTFAYFEYYVDLWTEEGVVMALLVQDRSRWSPQTFHMLYRPPICGGQLAGVLRIEDLGPHTRVGNAPRPERVDEIAGPFFSFEATAEEPSYLSTHGATQPSAPLALRPPATDFAPAVTPSMGPPVFPYDLPLYHLRLGDNPLASLESSRKVTLPGRRVGLVSFPGDWITSTSLLPVYVVPTFGERVFASNFRPRYDKTLELLLFGYVQIVDLDRS